MYWRHKQHSDTFVFSDEGRVLLVDDLLLNRLLIFQILQQKHISKCEFLMSDIMTFNLSLSKIKLIEDGPYTRAMTPAISHPTRPHTQFNYHLTQYNKNIGQPSCS